MRIVNGLDLKRCCVELRDEPWKDRRDTSAAFIRLLAECIARSNTLNIDAVLSLPRTAVEALASVRDPFIAGSTTYWAHSDDGIVAVYSDVENGKTNVALLSCFFIDDERGTGEESLSKAYAWPMTFEMNLETGSLAVKDLSGKPEEAKEDYQKIRPFLQNLFLILRASLALMSAEQVDVISDTARPSRRRETKAKGDVWEHRVVIRPGAARMLRLKYNRDGSSPAMRLHHVREHSADYTNGRGLFGRIHTKIRKVAHVRGDASLGILRAPHWQLRLAEQAKTKGA